MNLIAVILCAVIIAVNLIFAAIPLTMGQLRKKNAVKPNEFYPPRGASPIDVWLGYYGRRGNPKTLFNPLMLYWARRGLITVEQDCRRGLKLTKLKDIEAPKKVYNLGTFELERYLFNNIFKDGEVFYTLTADLKFTKSYDAFIHDCNNFAEGVGNKSSRMPFVVSTVLSVVSLAAVSLIIGLSLNEVLAVAMLFPIVGILFLRFINSLLNEGMAAKFLMYPFFLAWSGLPFLLVVLSLPTDAGVLLACTAAGTATTLFFMSGRIDIRDKDELKFYGEICAFKNFLSLTELNKLEILVADDPEYFFDILPYCYVLKLTKKLKPLFDRIKLDGPAPYLGELRNVLMY